MLLRHGARVRISDSAGVTLPPDLSALPKETGNHSLEFLEDVDLVVKSPGIPSDMPLVLSIRERGIPILSEVEVAYQLEHPRVTAVTGSFGKLDTVENIGRLAAQCGLHVPVGGNKGRPLSALLLESPAEWVALSLSSFQLESIVHFRPRIAVILNVREEHLDRHGDLVETIRIKSRVFMNQGPADTLVLNRDDPLVARLAEKHWGETLYVSLDGPVERGAWLEAGRMKIALDNGTLDLGPPNGPYPMNELCAALAVLLMGGSPEHLAGG
jgi:UDP-N-acetylmuramoylalanine--D-glutamate ligase